MLPSHWDTHPDDILMCNPDDILKTDGCVVLQTFDGDGQPVHGRHDRYDRLDDGTPAKARKQAGGDVTTHARGEGAIEGTADMYSVRSPYETSFAFSRFGAQSAPPRNVSALRG